MKIKCKLGIHKYKYEIISGTIRHIGIAYWRCIYCGKPNNRKNGIVLTWLLKQLENNRSK